MTITYQGMENDIGTNVLYNVQEDISDATLVKIIYEKPDGTTGEWVASVWNTLFAKYTTIAGDLQVGITSIQVYLESPTWTGTSTVQKISVLENLT